MLPAPSRRLVLAFCAVAVIAASPHSAARAPVFVRVHNLLTSGDGTPG